ncbi:DNA helicase UvrD [candidate division FCPU426 bacterium]|nr:DNA helicase UvrD [candidate division FCPU426 bacterium]
MTNMRMPRTGCAADLQEEAQALVFADLHLHSKYSRATSGQMEVQNLYYWGQRKGIRLLGTGDFTHPEYFRELNRHLEKDDSGFYRLRGSDDQVLFVPTAETSHIFKQGGKTRRIHMLLLASNLESAGEINRALAARGNVASDGRPIFGFSVRHLCKLLREIDPQILLVPAHIWTPWFSVLGERSGFDSLEECFEDELPYLAAVETGLSSDPEMNWRLSQLDGLSIISNSDAHSPARIGRECNAFCGPLTWQKLRETLLRRDRDIFRFTVEFFPEEGKYHWPGHSQCKISLPPEEYRRLQGICPVCRKPLTGGVASRVEMLADRPSGYHPPGAVPSVHLVPLEEVIAEALKKNTGTKAVQMMWDRMLEEGRNEMQVLLFMPEAEIAALAGDEISQAVMKMRRGEVEAVAGYDGVYGRIQIRGTGGRPAPEVQMSLLR